MFTSPKGSIQGDRGPQGSIWTWIRVRLRRWCWGLALAAGTGVAFGVTMAVSEETKQVLRVIFRWVGL
jgi:ABC-type nitrate/sulfonate/bicarbonate transport system permease component